MLSLVAIALTPGLSRGQSRDQSEAPAVPEAVWLILPDQAHPVVEGVRAAAQARGPVTVSVGDGAPPSTPHRRVTLTGGPPWRLRIDDPARAPWTSSIPEVNGPPATVKQAARLRAEFLLDAPPAAPIPEPDPPPTAAPARPLPPPLPLDRLRDLTPYAPSPPPALPTVDLPPVPTDVFDGTRLKIHGPPGPLTAPAPPPRARVDDAPSPVQAPQATQALGLALGPQGIEPTALRAGLSWRLALGTQWAIGVEGRGLWLSHDDDPAWGFGGAFSLHVQPEGVPITVLALAGLDHVADARPATQPLAGVGVGWTLFSNAELFVDLEARLEVAPARRDLFVDEDAHGSWPQLRPWIGLHFHLPLADGHPMEGL
ncbi:MAG: hypothetical protein ACE366_06050 [Bradymonadia bacterium]